MSEITHYKIQQIIDNGHTVQIAVIEDIQLEPISQKQIMMDAINKKLDSELKEQVLPLIEAIMQSQPTITLKSYDNTSINITMPKRRYEKMGSPKVGEKLDINIRRIS